MIRINRVLILFIILLLLNFTFTAGENLPEEKRVTKIDLDWQLTERAEQAERNLEISGLAWYNKKYLVLLPQYRNSCDLKPGKKPKLYTIPKEKIIKYLKNKKKRDPIKPDPVDFIIEPGLYDKISNINGFQGFEAIAFWKDRVFMTIEVEPPQNKNNMQGCLVTGEVEMTVTKKKITLKHPGSKKSKLVNIPHEKPNINNMAYETLLVTKDEVIALYEANGKCVNPYPRAYVYNHDLEFIKTLTFPHIEYRITDATDLYDDHRFWCINFFYPGDTELKPKDDPIAKEYGKGKTHRRSQTVERLVAFEYKSPDKITLVNGPPLQLKLKGCDQDDARNWEGIVRLDDPDGFLLVTDKEPCTILGFVEF